MAGPRRFDHDEARRLHSLGVSYSELARRFGVTPTAVMYACDARSRAADAPRKAEWQRGGVCVDCGGPCSRSSVRPVERCRACAAVVRRTTVRDDALKCARCKEWKWDTEFPWNRAKNCEHRRGRHGLCRACQTEAKRDYRDGRKIPCVRCGLPRLHPNDTGGVQRGLRDSGLCRACYVESGVAA